ncbi:MAG: hypothetical protein ABIA21_00400 [Candidatus Aenigmatarchaeota archaeon]
MGKEPLGYRDLLGKTASRDISYSNGKNTVFVVEPFDIVTEEVIYHAEKVGMMKELRDAIDPFN